jgi:hypothetical protein
VTEHDEYADAIGAPAAEVPTVDAPPAEAPAIDAADQRERGDTGDTGGDTALGRIAAAAAQVESVSELPLGEHAERYQRLHAALQAELAEIAGV